MTRVPDLVDLITLVVVHVSARLAIGEQVQTSL